MENKIAVVGENPVQKRLSSMLSSKGYKSEVVSFSELATARNKLKSFGCVVLPFPSRDNNVAFIRENDCTELFNGDQVIIGGLFDDEVKKHLESVCSEVYDYFTDDVYVLKNAYLTYQGVLRLLLENSDAFIAGKTALITGFGRIAKPLALALKTLGVKVYIAVRSDIQIAEAEMSGFDAFEIKNIKSTLFYYDYIFNTVPFNIFNESDVKHLKNNVLYFEIASKPYGVQAENFGLYGKKYVLASALPGKFFTLGVAENIFGFLLRKGLIN